MECEAATAHGASNAAPHQLLCSLTTPGIEAVHCLWQGEGAVSADLGRRARVALVSLVDLFRWCLCVASRAASPLAATSMVVLECARTLPMNTKIRCTHINRMAKLAARHGSRVTVRAHIARDAEVVMA